MKKAFRFKWSNQDGDGSLDSRLRGNDVSETAKPPKLERHHGRMKNASLSCAQLPARARVSRCQRLRWSRVAGVKDAGRGWVRMRSKSGSSAFILSR